MKIRVKTHDGNVRYFPCVYPYVGLDPKLHLFICKGLIRKFYFSDFSFDQLEFDFDWSDEVDYFGHSLKEPDVSSHSEYEIPKLK